MWFLIKGSFWTIATLVVLSFFSSDPDAPSAGEQTLAVSDAIGAATGAYTYISGLCTEKPEVCQKGAETFVALQQRAREGAKVAYQIIDRHMGEEAATPENTIPPQTDKLATGTVAPKTGTVETGSAETDAATVVHVPVPVPHAKPAR